MGERPRVGGVAIRSNNYKLIKTMQGKSIAVVCNKIVELFFFSFINNFISFLPTKIKKITL